MKFAMVFAAVTFFLGAVFSCGPSAPQLMPKETLFTLELGTLEDQMDLFLRSGMPSPQKNSFSFLDGLFVVANGNARKIMEFSSYGDMLTLFYNPDTNPQPVLLGLSNPDSQVRNRRAFSYPFNEVGEIALSAQNRLFVEDRIPVERRVFDPETEVQWESRLLRFDKDGKFLDFLGQEGIGGTPFPALDHVTVTASDEIVAVCRTGKGWMVYWFNSAGSPLDRVFLPYENLPPIPGVASAGLSPSLESLRADRHARTLHAKVDYFQKIQDPTTKTDSGVKLFQSRVWTYDLSKKSFTDSFSLPILSREKAKEAKEDPLGDRPFEFLGVADNGNLFFLSSPEEDSQRFLVCDAQGKVVLERNIQLHGENALFAQFYVSPKGLLAGLLSDGKKVEAAWWRSDKLLNSYGQTGF